MSLLLLRVDTSRRAGRPPGGTGISCSHYAHEIEVAQGRRATRGIVPIDWYSDRDERSPDAAVPTFSGDPAQQGLHEPDVSICVMILDGVALYSHITRSPRVP